jgi:methionine-rich copper-binding protein CopC
MGKSSRFRAMVVFAALGVSGQASAHAHLEASVPADKAIVVVSPAELGMRFSEELNLRFSGVKISGPGQSEVEAGPVKLRDDGKTLVVPLAASLGAGGYVVEWHVLSIDGHKVSGRFRFTVKP